MVDNHILTAADLNGISNSWVDLTINPPITATEIQNSTGGGPEGPFPTPQEVPQSQLASPQSSSWLTLGAPVFTQPSGFFDTVPMKTKPRRPLTRYHFVNDKTNSADSVKVLDMEVTLNEVYVVNLRPQHGINPDAFVRAKIIGRRDLTARLNPAVATSTTFSNERFTIDVIPEDMHLAHKILGKNAFIHQNEVLTLLETNCRSITFASWFMLQQTLNPPVFNPYKDPDWV